MSDYIRREDALMAVCRADLPDKTEDGTPILNGKRKVSDCVRRIKAIPAADVVERKHGKWELEPEYGWYICSACRDEVTVKSGRTNYCPNCGADLRGEDDEES